MGISMKKIALLLFFITPSSFSFSPIETERTIWQPWTVEHSQQWEEIELRDESISHFRRNEYFETMDELTIRDKNWLLLSDYIHEHLDNNVIFPDLGFAIIRKADHELIGTIRIKLNNKQGYFSFGYGLRHDMHNQKVGQEIIKTLTTLSDTLIKLPITTFKDGISKDLFMRGWYVQGKKEKPDFAQLLSYFSEQTQPFQGIIAAVSLNNQASLAVLIRNGMQPFEIECEKYYLNNNKNLYSFDFLLQDPSQQEYTQQTIKNLTTDILSRDQDCIDQAENKLKELFNIPSNWKYLQLCRAEKARLKTMVQSISVTLYSDINNTKNLTSQTHYPPYCFIK